MSLSDSPLRSIHGKPYTGKAEIADRDGLSIRITEAGTITWQYGFRFRSSAGRLTLCRFPDVKLAMLESLNQNFEMLKGMIQIPEYIGNNAIQVN